ncbi:Pex19 protein [Pseudovirgaria hyperparasitica]|uniref:Pex19 protein n=1 Tax=Pseudovirgaria hyperparasitica TaxID=470096 RepID=A0A6A6WCF8_9PEZI|nr:Pex19 protein [Pseudovirgaria hyperparasitica]KAF2759734.1 Pex19 protein [Pseudovirgaria hyperparasitica]
MPGEGEANQGDADVLDEFAHTKIDSKAEVPQASGPGRPAETTATTAPTEDSPFHFADDDFQKELQKGMADLLGEFKDSPDMKKQFETLMKELGDAAATSADGGSEDTAVPGSSNAGDPSASSKATEASFQETIRKTMERMQQSGDQASAEASSSADLGDDMMAQLLAEMAKEGGGGEEGFAKLLTDMMEELTNKDVLYEPMKELSDKFPDWMIQNKDKVSKEDLKRYEQQQVLVGEITAKFEEKNYSDKEPKAREYIVERMQKMQSVGAPPPDLVGDTNAAAEALAGMDEGCPQQ